MVRVSETVNYNFSGKFKVMFFLLLILIIILMPNVSADACCVTSNLCVGSVGANEEITEAECTQLAGTYYPNIVCSEVPTGDCAIGCCCTNEPQQNPGFKIECPLGVEFIPSTAGNCQELCASTDPMVAISGTLQYNDLVPAAGSVVFSNPSYTYTASTGIGQYSVNVAQSQVYDVTAYDYANECPPYVEQNFQVDTTPITKVITLDCPSPVVTQTCVSNWHWNWEFPLQSCGQRLNLIDLNSCPIPNPPRPSDSVICFNNLYECNINGNQDPGEQCEPPSNFFGLSSNSCDLFSPLYSGGNLGCTADCQINTDGCFDCPETVQGCTAAMCNSACPICNVAPICQPSCEDTAVPEIETPILMLTQQKGFNIEWDWSSADCLSEIQSYFIERKFNNIKINITQNLNKNASSYEDSSFPSDAIGRVCYTVGAIMAVPSLSPRRSAEVCVDLPNPLCAGREPNIQFCYEDNGQSIIGQCNELGQLTSTACGVGEMCVGPDLDGFAHCVDTSICSACNGPYGMFGFWNLPVDDFFQINPPKSVCESQELQGICYSDEYSKARSAIGQYKACSEVKSCYDFKTQNSCEGDQQGITPCEVEAAQDCEWMSFGGGNDIGLGVCRPENVEEQNCYECEQNNILGYCDREICSYFGAEGRCYYNEEFENKAANHVNDRFSCMNIEDVGCETYDTQTQCEGNPAQSFVADMIYSNSNIVDGTNEISNYSGDLLSRGTCYWAQLSNTYQCLKDADMSRYVSGTKRSDCGVNDLKCLSDFEYPTTEILLEDGGQYSGVEIRAMSVNVTDNVYTGQDIKTYFSLVTDPSIYSRPLTELNKLVFPSTPGSYALWYYSKDKANNYEPVKEFTFTLIKNLSTGINIVPTVTSWYAGTNGPDMWLSNLTIDISYETPLTCSVQLLNSAGTGGFLGDDTKYGASMRFTYSLLEDDTYFANINCYDNHQQTYHKTINVTIEADTTISSPYPRGLKFNGRVPIEIGINSTEDATCYYHKGLATFVPPSNDLNVPIRPEDWTPFENTGGTEHSSEVSEPYTGMKFYFTACDFGTNSFYGNGADLIYFAIDSAAPDTQVTDADTNLPYNYSVLKERVTLEFSCDDYRTELEYPELSGTSYEYGCDKILVCSYRGNVDCTPDYNVGQHQWKQTFIAPQGPQSTTVKVFVIDFGGNNKTLPLIPLNLRNLTFLPPNVTICDPEAGLYC